jgi:hypothetical protein
MTDASKGECDECDGTGEVFSRVVDGQTYVRICECVPPDEPDEGPVYGYRNRCARVRS